MKFLKKFELFGIIFLYLVSRLPNLLLLPIFNDEAIYIDWGTKELGKGFLFYSLYDGKPPLLMWIFGIASKMIADPLLAARLISVVAGLIALVGIYKLAFKYFSRQTAILASIFYIIVPLFAFFDRQALMESAIGAVGIWSIFLFLRFLDKQNLKNAAYVGIVLGVGIFIKQTGLVFLISIAIVYFWSVLKSKLYKFDWNFIYGMIISQIILLPLYFQSKFWGSLHLNNRFTFGLGELLSFPILSWFLNLVSFLSITFWYFSFPFIVAAISGFLTLKQKSQKIIAVYFFICLIIILAESKTLNTRYIVSFMPLITLFAASPFDLLKKQAFKILVAIFIVAIPSFFTIELITNPIDYFETLNKFTSYSQEDGYVEEWTSGYATSKAIDYIKSLSERSYLVVGVRVDTGNPESAILAYFSDSDRIKPLFFDLRSAGNQVLKYDCLSSSIPFYFVARDGNLAGMDKFLVLNKVFTNPVGSNFVSVYTLKSDCKDKILKVNF